MKIQRFLEGIEWSNTEEEKGGIIWVELYMLYAIHGGNKEEA